MGDVLIGLGVFVVGLRMRRTLTIFELLVLSFVEDRFYRWNVNDHDDRGKRVEERLRQRVVDLAEGVLGEASKKSVGRMPHLWNGAAVKSNKAA